MLARFQHFFSSLTFNSLTHLLSCWEVIVKTDTTLVLSDQYKAGGRQPVSLTQHKNRTEVPVNRFCYVWTDKPFPTFSEGSFNWLWTSLIFILIHLLDKWGHKHEHWLFVCSFDEHFNASRIPTHPGWMSHKTNTIFTEFLKLCNYSLDGLFCFMPWCTWQVEVVIPNLTITSYYMSNWNNGPQTQVAIRWNYPAVTLEMLQFPWNVKLVFFISGDKYMRHLYSLWNRSDTFCFTNCMR